MLKLGKKVKLLNLSEISTFREFLEIKGEGLEEFKGTSRDCELWSKLKGLSISSSALKIISPEILELPELEILKLQVGSDFHLPQNFILPATLKKFTLTGTDLPNLPENLFQNCGHLTEVHVQNNKLKDLPLSLAKCSKIQRVNLDNNLLEKIPVALTRLEHLSHLSMDQNKLTEEEKNLAFQLWGIWF